MNADNKNTTPDGEDKSQKKRRITGIEFPDDMNHNLEVATRITGKNKKELVLEALDKYLPEIVNASEEELEKLRGEFDRIVRRSKK